MPAITTTAGRRAATAYAARRRRAIAYGTWQPSLNPEPARRHVHALSAAGIGHKRAAGLAGLPDSVINNLIYGQAGRPPATRIRAETAAKLLAVTADNLADGARVPSAGTIRRMQALAAAGWSLSAQATAVGRHIHNYHNIFTRGVVQADTARTVADLYNRWSMASPPPGYAATYARNTAARNRWLPPLAWDDDTIDDPAAAPCVLPPVDGSPDGCDEMSIAAAVVYRGHPITVAVRDELVRRLSAGGYTREEIAVIARTTKGYVTQIRTQLAVTAAGVA